MRYLHRLLGFLQRVIIFMSSIVSWCKYLFSIQLLLAPFSPFRGLVVKMAPSAGVEPATHEVEARCSIQLSYEGFLKRNIIAVIASTIIRPRTTSCWLRLICWLRLTCWL